MRARSHHPFLPMLTSARANSNARNLVTTNWTSTDIVDGVGDGDDALAKVGGRDFIRFILSNLSPIQDLAIAKLSGVGPIKVFRGNDHSCVFQIQKASMICCGVVLCLATVCVDRHAYLHQRTM
jgi:hypothetical protein